MAHFAEIDSNNIVTRVLVVDNSQEDNGQEDKRTMGLELGTRTTTLCFATTTF